MTTVPPSRRSSTPHVSPAARWSGLQRRAATVLAVVVSVLVGLVALPSAASASTCSGANRSVASLGASKAEGVVRCLVNERRAAHGLSALGYDGRAASAAQRHTNDMVRRHYFSHVSPGGSTISQRISATGMHWRNVGENIAAGQRTPARVVGAWMRSYTHCVNLMNTRFTVLGVGISRHSTSGFPGPTWTQVFARPKGVAAPGGPSVRCPGR